eukprot:11816126-Ditylum_brightwellii.AAC.1
MAEKIGLGSVVKLDSPVGIIDQDNDPNNVCVTCRDGTQYIAKHAIAAFPPSFYKNIQWKPELPTEKLNVSHKYSMGHFIKTA